MHKSLTVVLLMICGLASGLDAAAAAARTSLGLASPLVDRSIYSPGAITRLKARFAGWTVVCDEIVALKQRFCSMRAQGGSDAYGHAVDIDVSTGDDGKPAALLHLPLLISVAAGLDVRIGGAPGAAGQRRRIAIAACSATDCQAVWTLDQTVLGALLAGRGIDLAYCSLRPGAFAFAADLRKRSCETRLVSILSGAGFREAVTAATHR